MSTSSLPQPLLSSSGVILRGTVTPPGDKSISHRAIMLGGIAGGETTIHGLLEGEDVLCTVGALRALGATITKTPDNVWQVKGIRLADAHAPQHPLDMGNSGTAARLLMGLVSGLPFATRFTGDASLSKRPMKRVIDPLSQMGAVFNSTDGRMPLEVVGTTGLKPITYKLPVASAQVKSAILLAGLSVDGETTVIETAPTRDHSENMLRHFGATVRVIKQADGSDAITIVGRPTLTGQTIVVPADPSSAAFPLIAAILNEGSEVVLRNVGINPRRAGIIETLMEMGADITLSNRRDESGEPVADLIVRGSRLHGIDVPAERAPSMIDEYPVLSVAAACASGTTRMRGLGELRVKESDRLALMAEGLMASGARVEIDGDDLIVHGTGHPPQGGCTIRTAMDHRIAMSFLVLGTVSEQPISVDDGAFIATSFPNFVGMMNGLGCKIGISA